jgi:hypothetical protein
MCSAPGLAVVIVLLSSGYSPHKGPGPMTLARPAAVAPIECWEPPRVAAEFRFQLPSDPAGTHHQVTNMAFALRRGVSLPRA